MNQKTEQMAIVLCIALLITAIISVLVYRLTVPQAKTSEPVIVENELKAWELFEYDSLKRAKVPGGYLYRYYGSDNLVFVPDSK